MGGFKNSLLKVYIETLGHTAFYQYSPLPFVMIGSASTYPQTNCRALYSDVGIEQAFASKFCLLLLSKGGQHYCLNGVHAVFCFIEHN